MLLWSIEVSHSGIRDRIIEKLEGLDRLPTLPVVVALLNKEIKNPNASASSVARIIDDDPPIMTRVLKLVNSPLYAPSFNYRKNITIQAAVVRLGMNVLRDLVITTSVLKLFPARGQTAFDRKEFWRHSISCGFVAGTVLNFSSLELPFPESEIILAGLCHDIGKILLDQYFNEEFMGVIEAAKQEQSLLYESEERLLKIHHGEVGDLLAERWKLPNSIRNVIRYHHYPSQAADKDLLALTHLIHLSDYICNHQNLGFSGNYRAMAFPEESFKVLDLDVKDIPDIIERVREEARKSDILLSLDN